MPVHNHGTEDGPGLDCREVVQPDGSLRGVCMGESRPTPVVKAATVPLTYGQGGPVIGTADVRMTDEGMFDVRATIQSKAMEELLGLNQVQGISVTSDFRS